MLTLPLTAAACGGASASGRDDGGTPVKDGTLTFAVNTEPLNLDPHASPQDVTGLFTRPVLDSLISLDARGGIRPWLATSTRS